MQEDQWIGLVPLILWFSRNITIKLIISVFVKINLPANRVLSSSSMYGNFRVFSSGASSGVGNTPQCAAWWLMYRNRGCKKHNWEVIAWSLKSASCWIRHRSSMHLHHKRGSHAGNTAKGTVRRATSVTLNGTWGQTRQHEYMHEQVCDLNYGAEWGKYVLAPEPAAIWSDPAKNSRSAGSLARLHATYPV